MDDGVGCAWACKAFVYFVSISFSTQAINCQPRVISDILDRSLLPDWSQCRHWITNVFLVGNESITKFEPGMDQS